MPHQPASAASTQVLAPAIPEAEPAAMRIRVATVADAAELLSIYAPYVERTAVTFELATPSLEEFERRIAQTLEQYPYLVAETAGRRSGQVPEIVGYAYAGPYKTRAAYAWSVETSVYVHSGLRRSGLGRRLYRALEDALVAQGVLNLNACIAHAEEDDEYLTRASERFHEALGFRHVGVFRQCGYKFGRWYDAAWMEKHIGAHKGAPLPLQPFSAIAKDLFDLSWTR